MAPTLSSAPGVRALGGVRYHFSHSASSSAQLRVMVGGSAGGARGSEGRSEPSLLLSQVPIQRSFNPHPCWLHTSCHVLGLWYHCAGVSAAHIWHTHNMAHVFGSS